MWIARILLALLGAYLILRGIQESRLPDGQIIEKQVYIALYSVGAILLLGGIFLPVLCRVFKKSMLVQIFSLLVCAVQGFVFVTTGLIATAPLFAPKADSSGAVTLVLGAPVIQNKPSSSLQSRADTAAAWVGEHPGMQIIISGGKGGAKTEAETIADLMEQSGTDRGHLILQKRSTTTEENLIYTKELLKGSVDVATEPVNVLTNWFHVYRLRYLLAQQGYGNVRFITAPTPSSTRLIWYARQVVLMIRYWLTGIS